MTKRQIVTSFACLATLFLATGTALADDEADADFTQRLVSTGEECTKITGTSYVFAGKLNVSTDQLSVSGCSNISDGLRAVCQDGDKLADSKAALVKGLAKVKTVVCEYADPKAKTAAVKLNGGALHVWINIDMPDPSERARCMIAQALKLKYKGDLDAKCLERKH
jgi:hypothetical protein